LYLSELSLFYIFFILSQNWINVLMLCCWLYWLRTVTCNVDVFIGSRKINAFFCTMYISTCIKSVFFTLSEGQWLCDRRGRLLITGGLCHESFTNVKIVNYQRTLTNLFLLYKLFSDKLSLRRQGCAKFTILLYNFIVTLLAKLELLTVLVNEFSLYLISFFSGFMIHCSSSASALHINIILAEIVALLFLQFNQIINFITYWVK
jgi:hypothetical protein